MRGLLILAGLVAAWFAALWVTQEQTPEQVLQEQIRRASDSELPSWKSLPKAASEFSSEQNRLLEIIERKSAERTDTGSGLEDTEPADDGN